MLLTILTSLLLLVNGDGGNTSDSPPRSPKLTAHVMSTSDDGSQTSSNLPELPEASNSSVGSGDSLPYFFGKGNYALQILVILVVVNAWLIWKRREFYAVMFNQIRKLLP